MQQHESFHFDLLTTMAPARPTGLPGTNTASPHRFSVNFRVRRPTANTRDNQADIAHRMAQ